MKPKISIVVPVYKVEEYLHKCINSILNQTFKDFELILVDDGSPDNCGKICDEYAEIDNRVIVIHKENEGVSSARNIGINIAIGKYIAFVDPDDDVDINMYEILLNKISKYDTDIVVCSFNVNNLINGNISKIKVWDENNSILNRNKIKNEVLPKLLNCKDSYGYGFYSCFNKIYKLDKINENKIRFEFGRQHGEDLWFNLQLLTCIESICVVNKELYNYYIRKRESLTQSMRKDLYKYILSNKQFHEKFCKDNDYYNLIENGNIQFLNVTMDYMIRIVISNFKLKNKYLIIKEILIDNEFKNFVIGYKVKDRFYKILKGCCIIKSPILFIFFVRLFKIKYFFKLTYLKTRRWYNYEN